MNAELEKLIDFALADGVITDKEREIIRKKVEKLGEDPDEAEMILDAKLAMKGNQATTPPPTASNPPPINTPTAASGPPPINVPPANSTSNKVGNIQTCPACGATVNAMELNCSECRHEFRNIKSENSMNALFETLVKIDSRASGGLFDNASAINKGKVTAISTFPVPNSREAILEFLAQAYPKAKGHGSAFKNFFNESGNESNIRQAWKLKCEEIIIKARFSMKEDKKTLEEIEYYAKQLKIK